MKNHLSMALAVTFAVLSGPTLAHDPSAHEQKDATAPDCSSVQDRDATKMDMNDPLMKALHDQCKNIPPHDHMQGQDMKDMPGMDGGAAQPSDGGGK